MNSRLLGIGLVIAIVISATAATTLAPKPTEDTMDVIRYVVKKIGGTWYVVDRNDRREPIRAKRRDIIVWTARGSDMKFQFPARLEKYFVDEDGRVNGRRYVIDVKQGEKLRLRVKPNAPLDRIVYAVYVKKDGEFAEGSSPPVIIIGN